MKSVKYNDISKDNFLSIVEIHKQSVAFGVCVNFFESIFWKMPNDHHHHGAGCEHESTDSDHSNEIGIQYSLYKKIDMENLECLNETTDGSGKLVFKPYEERLNFDKVRNLIGL